MRHIRLIIGCWMMILPAILFAQHHHDHPRNEIGISPGVTYSPSHQTWGLGIHAHYFRTLSEHSPWALGGSIEQVFTHGNHWTLSAGASYRLWEGLTLAVMPGVTFFKHDDEGHEHALYQAADEHRKRARFSTHFELAYELIHWKHFHAGSAIDYSWSRHDSHFMLGVHCAYAF